MLFYLRKLYHKESNNSIKNQKSITKIQNKIQQSYNLVSISGPYLMNTTLINILETSPTYIFEQEITLDSSLALRYIILSFDLILLSTLNHAKLKQIILFTFYIDKFFSQVKLKVSNDFDFVKMKYDSTINLTYPKEFVRESTAYVDKYNHEESKVQRVTLKYSLQDLDDQKELRSQRKTKIKFNFGDFNNTNKKRNVFGSFSIQNLKYEFEINKNLRKQSTTDVAKYPLVQSSTVCNHEDEGGSFPLLYMKEQNNLKQKGETYFLELLENLELYNSTNTTLKPNHLFISHDMKDGYIEDTRFTNPVERKRANSFRFNYLWQTSTLNYFSHNTISIPPRHWREICKKYQIKCLGTFIAQAQRIDQSYFLSNQFALKLVYLAKKYQFDGYLINIENQIKNITNLKTWLQFLTSKIHEQIPGSSISWYDSVTVDGTVTYQNQINQHNKIFYDLTDSFFTNYWWTDQKLKADLKQAQPNKTIYVGNDVWGRGTYGGGQFYLYKAIDEIQKLNQPGKPNLVPALFAPGYTYQQGGQNNNPYLKANEDRLYRGVIFSKQDIKGWKPILEKDLKLLALENGKKWFSKFYTMGLWLYKNKGKLKITFTFKINETLSSPDSKLDYKIVLRLHDLQSDETVEITQVSRKNVELTQKSVKQVKFIIDTDKMTSKCFLEIFQATTIHDIFDQQKILFSYYLPEIDWIQKVPITQLPLNQPYNSYLNMGYGDYFYFRGQPILRSYDYMADYDLPQTLSINHPFFTSIEHQDAYIGGSSLFLQSPTIKLFPIDLPATQYNYPHSYQAKIVSKGGPIESLYFSQSSGFSIFFTKISEKQLENEWVQQIYEIPNQSMKKMGKKFFKDLQTSLMINLKSKCLLGQISLLPRPIDEIMKQVPKLQLSISQSFRSHNKDQIYINLELHELLFKQNSNSQKSIRYLVTIDDQFSSFIYMQKSDSLLKGKLGQISLKMKNSKTKVEVYDLDHGLKEQILLSELNIDLFQLKSSPLSHKIKVRNY